MTNDMSQLKMQLHAAISIISPDTPRDILSVRVEEVLYNYNIEQKSYKKLANDLNEKFEMFLSAKEMEGHSPKTIKDYRMELRLFNRFVSKPTVQIDTRDIREYLSSLDAIEMSTRGKKLTVLRSFFGWLVEEEVLLKNPTTKIKSPKKKRRLPKGLSVGELAYAREMCSTHRERALLEVLYSTGARLSEITGMRISEYNHQNMCISVIGKGNKERKVYLTEGAKYHLDRYLSVRKDKCECDYLFITTRKPYRQVSNRSIQDEVEKIGNRCNLSKKITPHVFRHTLAQTLLDNGAALEEVQHILGHSEISTTQIYAHVSEERKRSAHKRFAN